MDGYSIVSKSAGSVAFRPLKGTRDVHAAQLALDAPLKTTAYRIRYDAYKSYGYVGERAEGTFYDEYDKRMNCQTAVVFKSGVAAATIRVALYDSEHPNPDFHQVQAMEIFGGEMKAVLASIGRNGRTPRAVEIGKLARSTSHAMDMDVVFAMFRTAGYLILHHDVDVVFNAVRAHHMPMYRRFGFQQLEEPRLYPGLTFKTGLMACFRTNFHCSRNSLPFLRGISTDDDAYASLIAGKRVPIYGPQDDLASVAEPRLSL